MRMTPEQLEDLTGFTHASAQVRWFRDHFGVSVPADRAGPIVTAQAVEGMVAKRCGLAPEADAARPLLILRRVK